MMLRSTAAMALACGAGSGSVPGAGVKPYTLASRMMTAVTVTDASTEPMMLHHWMRPRGGAEPVAELELR